MTVQEITEIQEKKKKNNWSINQTKDFIQNMLIYFWLKLNGWGILECFTGFGKTMIGYKAIVRFRAKYEDKILVVVPTEPLKDQWKNKLKDIPNVVIEIINTVTMSEQQWNCGLLIIDEIHRAANEDSVYFSQLMNKVNTRFCLGLTATLDKKQKDYLKNNFKLDVVRTLSIDEGYACEIIPEYYICNVGVELNDNEKNAYYIQNKNYNMFLTMFSKAHYDKAWDLAMACSKSLKNTELIKIKLGKYSEAIMTSKDWCQWVADKYKKECNNQNVTVSEVNKWGILFMKAMAARNNILLNCRNKIDTVTYLLNRGTKKTIVFSSQIKILDNWKSSDTVIYHSKLSASDKRATLSLVAEGNKRVILSCGALDEGYDNDKLEVAINHSFTSKKRQIVQRTGRIARADLDNPMKKPIMICLYCKSFTWGDTQIDPQDGQRLHAAQRDLGNVENVELTEIIMRI